jgi:hypothetical protein
MAMQGNNRNKGLLGNLLGGSVDDIDARLKARIDEFAGRIDQLIPYLKELTEAVRQNTAELRQKR